MPDLAYRIVRRAAGFSPRGRAGACSSGRRLFCVLVLALSMSSLARTDDTFEVALDAVRADENARVAALAQASKAVVCIFAGRQESGGGAGVVIDPAGYGLTNYHVVGGFIKSRRGFGGMSDGKLYPLTVLGLDPGGDIALFKLEGRERFDFAPLGDSDLLHVGQRVAAMGNPFVLAEDYTPTITLGVVSGLRRYQGGQGAMLEYADCIQVSTSINPGNSGGPLFDPGGRVVGINGRASFEERGRVNVGLGYAVSVNQIKRFMPGLRAGRAVNHGTLGATVRTAGGELLVSAIQQLSAAERAGVQLGDELLEVAGRTVRTPNDYNNIIAIMPANWPVKLKLRRDGELLELGARLDRLPLRGMPAYVVDLRHNRTELAGILDAARERIAGDAASQFSRIKMAGRMRIGDGDVVSFTVDLLGASVADATALSEQFQREWRRLSAPLLRGAEDAALWEFVGGDEIDGRIVNVVERSAESGPTIRWKFDVETAELLEVEFVGDGTEPDARWRAGTYETFAGLSWPATWTRQSPASDDAVFEIDSLTLVQPDSQPTSGDSE